MAIQRGKLFMIPTPIIENGNESITQEAITIIHSLNYFIVEKARTARRFISSTNPARPIEDLLIEEISEVEIENSDIEKILEPLTHGKNMGIMSEAGLPAVADPGNKFVACAQRMGIIVIPLAGPSSIMMALMASGLEGQRFAFHGYLSAKKSELPSQLRHLDQRADQDNATQIFIETPYRNTQIIEAVERNISSSRNFCIAAGIGDPKGFVITKTVAEWKKNGWPPIHKIPAVFLFR